MEIMNLCKIKSEVDYDISIIYNLFIVFYWSSGYC